MTTPNLTAGSTSTAPLPPLVAAPPWGAAPMRSSPPADLNPAPQRPARSGRPESARPKNILAASLFATASLTLGCPAQGPTGTSETATLDTTGTGFETNGTGSDGTGSDGTGREDTGGDSSSETAANDDGSESETGAGYDPDIPGRDASFPVWSPDGNELAYVRAGNRDGLSQIVVVSMDGSVRREVTDGAGKDYWPTWSPDGQRLAFASNREAESDEDEDIFLIHQDGTGLTMLTDDSCRTRMPDWSPDGEHIVFTSAHHPPFGCQNEAPDVIAVDGSDRWHYEYAWVWVEPRWISNTSFMTWSLPGFGDDPDFSDVSVMNPLSDEIINSGPVTEYARFPRVVADGSLDPNEKYAIAYETTTTPRQVVIDNPYPQAEVRTSDAFDSWSPDWSPDGETVAFMTSRDGTHEVYLMSASGDLGPTRLTELNGGTKFSPKFSPDSAKIAFVSDEDGEPDIWVMNTDGSESINLTK